jgi:hypothetical protein
MYVVYCIATVCSVLVSMYILCYVLCTYSTGTYHTYTIHTVCMFPCVYCHTYNISYCNIDTVQYMYAIINTYCTVCMHTIPVQLIKAIKPKKDKVNMIIFLFYLISV